MFYFRGSGLMVKDLHEIIACSGYYIIPELLRIILWIFGNIYIISRRCVAVGGLSHTYVRDSDVKGKVAYEDQIFR